MRRNNFPTAAGYTLALVGLLFALAAGASAASKENVIYSFTGGSDGANPYSDLVMDAAGNLYGTTYSGGSGKCGNGSCGTVFELRRTADGWKEEVLYSFTGASDGAFPQTGLIFDVVGNLYGTTPGNVFELSPNSHGGWTFSLLYTFTGGRDGDSPAGDLVFDSNGNLYGANSGGGTKCNVNVGCGTVFKLTPQAGGSWTETTLHDFTANSSDGVVPSSGVVLDSAGNVYGMTLYGGAGTCSNGGWFAPLDGCGTIYELTPGSGGNWTETILHTFLRGCASGIYPSGGLLFDKAGHVYGTSQAGGNGAGTFLELHNSQKNGWQRRDLHLFYGNPDGGYPVGRLVVDRDGNLFGVTEWGGLNQTGVVFEFRYVKDGWKERILYSFPNNGAEGVQPQAGLVMDSKGHLYGTTEYGGSGTACNYGCGTAYEVTP